MKQPPYIETFYVIQNEDNKFWYAFQDKFKKSVENSTWFSRKRNAKSQLKDLLKDGRCEYGTVIKYKTLIK